MDNAPKSWLLLRTTPRHTHLPAEGTRQPVTYLTRHRLCLQVAELILGVQKTPSQQTETSVSNSSNRRGQRCIQSLVRFTFVSISLLRLTSSHLCKQRPAWQQPALCSCGVPSCPQPLGPSARGPSSVWQYIHFIQSQSTVITKQLGDKVNRVAVIIRQVPWIVQLGMEVYVHVYTSHPSEREIPPALIRSKKTELKTLWV